LKELKVPKALLFPEPQPPPHKPRSTKILIDGRVYSLPPLHHYGDRLLAVQLDSGTVELAQKKVDLRGKVSTEEEAVVELLPELPVSDSPSLYRYQK